MATKAHEARIDRLQRIGCICCRKIGIKSQIDVHHIVEGYRLGDEFTLPLCPYHHRGDPPDGMSSKEARAYYGPSLRLEKRNFKAKWGSERMLLAEIDALVIV